MQYILTDIEYNELLSNKKETLKLGKKELQKLCTKIANEMPIAIPWDKNAPKEPWKCRLGHTSDNDWYCDHCPVQSICPADKNWSK